MQTIRRVVGRIAKPHGVRGEVQVEIRTDEPDVRFRAGITLLMDDTSITIESAKVHGKYLLVKFQDFDTRNDVESLRNRLLEIEVNPSDRPSAADEYYDYQLVGLEVRMATGKIGVVKEVLHLPAQDVLVVQSEDIEHLIPFVKEIVTEVNIDEAYVVIDPPPGLFSEVDDED